MRVEIIPGKLAVRVETHEVPSRHGAMACWSYVTDGLAAFEQTEIVFTLRRDVGDPASGPEEPMRLFSTIAELAARGQRVSAGGVTEFGERRFFDHHLLYVTAQPLPGVALPSPCLAALLITDDELRAVRSFGPSRVLARLGQAASHYPFPAWSDRRRPGLSLAKTFEASVLSKVRRMAFHSVHVGTADDRVTLSALRGEAALWQERLAQLPEDAPLALLTAIDPAANGCMTWVPGQTEPEAIVPPGSDGTRVCGCFVVFVPGQPANGGKLLEDGCAIELTTEAWQSIRRALVDGRDLAVPATGAAMSFALTWRDRPRVAAVAGAGYGARPMSGRLALGPVKLLTPEDQFAQRTSAEELGEFCREIQRCADRVLGGHDGQLELRLQLICRPRSHRAGLSHRGDLPEATIDKLIEAVEQLPSLRVQSEVSFEVELTLSAGPRDLPS
jgi:hypothetical protein